MKTKQTIIGIVLVVLLGATIYGLWLTDPPRTTLKLANAIRNSAESQTAVDQTPLLAAERLAQLPTSAEEVQFAQEALRIADHEMDLVYAAAQRDFEQHPPALSPDAKKIDARLREAEDALALDNAQVERLTAEVAKATGVKKDDLEDQLILATSHQEEHQDEVDDAKQDFLRAGGDSKSRIQALIEEHESSSKAVDSLKISATSAVEEHGLIHLFSQWSLLHQKYLLLWQARQQAESSAASFSAKHDALEAQLEAEKTSAPPSAGRSDAGNVSGKAGTPAKLSHEASAALAKAATGRAARQKILASLDKRIDNQKQLAANYQNWIAVVAAKQSSVVHRMLTGLLIILIIALIGLFFDTWLERLLGKTSLDRRQVETLRTVTRVTVQVFAVLFILLVIFGPPSQLGTFLGLAGAGLTVALKDFIIGFFGWFVLMGKNGIRLGDWVEINGVTGEVVELGMFHTVLLETGNWTDSGHPTGRRVTFTNSFAIEGHYFNFSTSGQWLWDELQVVLPPGKDPYPIIEALQKKVLEATSVGANEAEKEWKNAARSRDMSALTAAPAINVKPVIGGVEIAVRYITKANERYQLRAKLYQAAVDLLGTHPGAHVETPPPPAV